VVVVGERGNSGGVKCKSVASHGVGPAHASFGGVLSDAWTAVAVAQTSDACVPEPTQAR
jgi:hypothetical protein